MMLKSCFAVRISAVISLAMVSSSSGEVSLAILAGRSASTVAGAQISSNFCASSSCSSHLSLSEVCASTRGAELASASTDEATEAIGKAYLLFQN